MKSADILIINAAELATMGPDGIIPGGAVAIVGGRIAEVGRTDDLLTRWKSDNVIDAGGKTVTPGLIDSHTHLVFAGSRENEFELRIKGAGYMEIARAGGGILSTVRAVRSASKSALKALALDRLRTMREHGTTAAEVKSGYGLNLDDEIKMLEVVAELNKEQTIELFPTFLGAHEVPPEYKGRTEEYVRFLIEEVLPVVGKRKLARFCDVFCEEGVFNIEQSRRILEAAKRWGMTPRFHADEFVCLNGAVLAAEVGAISADHLLAVSDEGIAALKRGNVIATLLPGTSFFLALKHYAPARKLIEAGVRVALASDFNPGSCPTANLQIVMTLACAQMKMTPLEALTACTINAAAALGVADRMGSIEAGKEANLLLWKAENHRVIPYRWGMNLAERVIVRGVDR